MRLHYHPLSSYSRKVAIGMALRGDPVELDVVDPFRGDLKTPEFLAMNPFGKMPVLETDDGEAIFESTSILEYLEERGPRRLIPLRHERRARRFDRLGNLYLMDPVGKFFWNKSDAVHETTSAVTGKAWALWERSSPTEGRSSAATRSRSRTSPRRSRRTTRRPKGSPCRMRSSATRPVSRRTPWLRRRARRRLRSSSRRSRCASRSSGRERSRAAPATRVRDGTRPPAGEMV